MQFRAQVWTVRTSRDGCREEVNTAVRVKSRTGSRSTIPQSAGALCSAVQQVDEFSQHTQAEGGRAAATICLRPCKLSLSSYLLTRWHLFRHVGYLRHHQQVDLRPFDLESGVRVTCDVVYLCTNFSLPRPLCSRLRSDVRYIQTDVRRALSLNASALWGRGHNN